jgi:hypothetical protein
MYTFKLDSIPANAKRINVKKYWFGETREDAMSEYRAVVSHGFTLKCNYAVSLTPYKDNGILVNNFKKIPEGKSKPQPSIINLNGLGSADIPIWLLATDVDMNMLTADIESIKVGNSQLNRLAGATNSDVQITFLETSHVDVLSGLQIIQSSQFNDNGTQNLPAEYAMWLKVDMFDRYDRTKIAWSRQLLVCLQTIANLGLTSSEHTPLTIQATFMQLNPYFSTPK